MEFVSLERSSAPDVDKWLLTLSLSESLIGGSKEAAPAIDVSACTVQVSAADGQAVGSYSLPSGHEAGPIDSDATCRLQRRRRQLQISWLAAALPAPPVEVATSTEEKTSCQSDVQVATEDKSKMVSASAKGSIDYSRFAGIGDDEDSDSEEKRAARLAQAQVEPPKPTAAQQRTVPGRSQQRGAIDYSRFSDLDEDDATLSEAELDKKWQRHCKLRKMRGEEPLSLQEWRRKRSRWKNDMGDELDPEGRGLWCRTNMEEQFEQDASTTDRPTDEDLPVLAKPDILSAMAQAPGAQTRDETRWAKDALQRELLKACASDRSSSSRPADVRVDVIAHSVDVGDGNAAMVIEGGGYLCAYRFTVKLAYCINVAERPPPGQQQGTEHRIQGDIHIKELASGCQGIEELTALMRTSLQEPKLSKAMMARLRPLLGRLERSVAYFVRRFERRFLERPMALGMA